MVYRPDITEVSFGYAIQSRRDTSPGSDIAQVTEPRIESGGFDQFEHGLSVNHSFHTINDSSEDESPR